MSRAGLTVFWLLAGALVARAAPERTWHVAPAPRGDDAHDGSAAAPFATPDRARRAVRAHLAAHPRHGELAVEFAAGTYELAAPVRFEPADSGRENAPVVYCAAAGADVVLSGGRAVRGWSIEGDGTWRAEVGRGVDFRQLWIDDRRAVRARAPNLGQTYTLAAEKQADGFDVPSAQLADVTLRPDEVEFSIPVAWMHKRLRIARVERHGETTRAIIDPREWDAVTKQPQGDRVYLGRSYWLENAPEFLDAPGEFHLDRASGVLRYRPRPGEELARARGVRPELESLIVLAGRLDAPVHDLRFEGLTFAHTGWTRPNRAGFVDVQANSLVPADPAAAVDPQYRHDQRKDRIPAALQAATSDRITVRGCRFARLGGAGIVFTHGGDDNVIEQNSFYDLAAGGIEFGEDAARPANPRLIPRRNRIANNFLAHVGEDYFGSVAILGYYTDASVIAHNELAGLPYTAISQGWGWGTPAAPDGSRANRILRNRISNFLRRLDDGGGIYTTDRLPGTEIAGNTIERMTPPDDRKKAGAALYPDQCTEGTHWHDNVVAEVPRWLHLWNPNIHGNRIAATYADTAAHRNDGPDNRVEAARVFPDRRWPAAAQAILDAAGLEPACAHVREFAAPADVIVESTSVDFQLLAGTWSTQEAAGGYGATCQESSDLKAAARWLPILPKDGRYEVSVWRPARSAASVCTIKSAHAQDREATLPANAAGGWETLGVHALRAGIGTEITLQPAARHVDDGGPLRADAVRLVWRGP